MASNEKQGLRKDVSYLGRDFDQLRTNLMQFAKTYFPDTYNDFNEADPGMMFMEQVAYVGDVLGYYTDVSLKESQLFKAEDKRTIYDLANASAYKVKLAHSAHTTLDVYQLVPSRGLGANTVPNFDYSQILAAGMEVTSTTNPNVVFRTTDVVDFTFSSSLDPMEISVYSVNDVSGDPTYYLLKKSVQVVSGKRKTVSFTFGVPKQYDKVRITDDNIIQIESVVDSDGDTWSEVPYLAQQTLIEDKRNTDQNFSDEISQFRADAPYILELKKTAKRFVTRITADDQIELQFGGGTSDSNDEEIIPNPNNVGSNLYLSDANIDLVLDPTNFLHTRTYGLAPGNTTLTITYVVGNGITDNIPSGVLTDITGKTFLNTGQTGLNAAMLNTVRQSIAVRNPIRATGGRLRESLTELKENIIGHIGAQQRAVTKEDYLTRVYAMPGKYGYVAKAALVKDTQFAGPQSDERIQNPFALNLHVLGYDSAGKLTTLNDVVKRNVKNYLRYYRILTDAVNILDAFVINIGIDFEIVALPDYNNNEVLLRCVQALQQHFDIRRWQINEPIIIAKLYTLLDRVDGVQTVQSLRVKNLCGGNYSGWTYDIDAATRQGVLYPSLDPSVFEVKFPASDIKGRVVPFRM